MKSRSIKIIPKTSIALIANIGEGFEHQWYVAMPKVCTTLKPEHITTGAKVSLGRMA